MRASHRGREVIEAGKPNKAGKAKQSRQRKWRMNIHAGRYPKDRALGKFQDPDRTASGEVRAKVPLVALETLWFNTGTLCNIACLHCYIESTPTNDRLVYLTANEVHAFLDEIEELGKPTREIGFTGGEPFMNPHMLEMMEDALSRGHRVLVLTNAMQPMQRPRIKTGLLALRDRFQDRLTLRVSLDHYSRDLHESERGENTFDKSIAGLNWLAENGFSIAIAGRTCWGECEEAERAGYAALIGEHGWSIDPNDPGELTLFPEMDETAETPEITEACWDIVGKRPEEVMCAKTRMVVKRRGAPTPSVLPCTLITYDERFDMGSSLAAAQNADGHMFDCGAVKLCHPHCSKFCVLGGGSCS